MTERTSSPSGERAAVERLEPCPFHPINPAMLAPATGGSLRGTAAELQTAQDVWAWSVRCWCGCSGPEADTEAAAIAAWNTRSNHLPRPVDAKPGGAGWSAPPTEEAAHPERLSAEELRLTGSALSDWAWEHLSKGYAVSLSVREVSRLIAAVATNAQNTRPTPSGDGLVEALKAEIGKPLEGPTHDAWDRGRRSGLKDALAIVRQALAHHTPVCRDSEEGGEA